MNPTKSFEPKYCPDCDEYAPCSCGRAKKPDAEKLKAELLVTAKSRKKPKPKVVAIRTKGTIHFHKRES